MKMMSRILVTALLSACQAFLNGSAFAQDPAPSSEAPPAPELPVVKAQGGPCMADFIVVDAVGKPLFDAKIAIQLEYGFLGRNKLDLRVGTNTEGKARVDGMPERPRRLAEFKITHGTYSKSIRYAPDRQCYAQHTVILGN
jgi:hypothetical protein